MPKSRIQRFYYRNRRIHTEIREMDGELHGFYRTWHFNGQLAGELRYQHGRLHGLSREWDENGRLLGSFTMNHGTGTQRYWHDNDRLKMEIDSLDGRIHGRTRIWLRDGTLIRETYLIGNRDVTRSAYLKAARKNPGWPQYEAQPAGRVARHNAALERKEHNLFIQSVLEKPDHAEARVWLNAKAPANRSLAKFPTAKTALRFVDQLYAAGADAVIIAAIYSGKRHKLFADWLLVQLPGSKSKRAALRKICREFCRKRGGAALPDKDIAETHLFMMLA
jgi:hypothetical protein